MDVSRSIDVPPAQHGRADDRSHLISAADSVLPVRAEHLTTHPRAPFHHKIVEDTAGTRDTSAGKRAGL